jgi:hypothetical protein
MFRPGRARIEGTAKGTRTGRLAMIDIPSRHLPARVSPAIGIDKLRRAKLCRCRNRLPEMKEDSEGEQKAQDNSRPLPVQRIVVGSPPVTAFAHQPGSLLAFFTTR